MTAPESMFALTMTESGFGDPSQSVGPRLDSLEPYLKGEEIATPQPGPGQALVKLRLSAVNPSDIHFIKGEYGLPRVKGGVAGFEGCGDVVAVGAGAEGLMGKRCAVFVSPKGTGLWAEYVLADAASCVPLPDMVRDEDAAALFVNPLTAIGMITLAAEAGAEAVLMTAGGSSLGKLMTAYAKDKGVKAVPVVRREAQAAQLKDLGAAEVLVTTAGDYEAKLGAALSEMKPTVLLDAVVDQTSTDLFFAMPPKTRWVIYGKLAPGAVTTDQLATLVFTQKQIEGFWLTAWLGRKSKEETMALFGELFQRFGSGAWGTDVGEKIPLREAHARLPALTSAPNAGKVFIAG
ncbi:MAG: zinc-binding dehydrogenase [Pseudomonadota bacterium]